jgi:hypothetical protein
VLELGLVQGERADGVNAGVIASLTGEEGGEAATYASDPATEATDVLVTGAEAKLSTAAMEKLC